jgi:hypothetical protein
VPQDQISVRLGHRTGKGEFVRNPEPNVEWRSTTEFLLVPLELTTPADGVAPTQLTCPACGATVTFQVRGTAEVNRRRIRNFALGAAFLLVVIALVLFKDPIEDLEGGLGQVVQWVVFLGLIGAAVGAVANLSRALTSRFRRTVIFPNMAYWMSQNHPDSIRLGYYKKRTGPTEMNGHQLFPAKGKLEDATSL